VTIKPARWAYNPPRNQRLDPTVYTTIGQSVSFTIRAAPGVRPFVQPQFAKIAVECLLGQREANSCEVDVYVVMPDHVHAVVTPVRPGASSLTFIDRFKGSCSFEMRKAGWNGPVWQKRSFDHAIRKDEDLVNVGRYILGNPVRAGLSSSVDEYLWSGIPEKVFAVPGP
jgi:putative transposase